MSILDAPLGIVEVLVEHAPRVIEAFERAADVGALLDSASSGAAESPTRRAFMRLTNNVANDWIDLITDCRSGRGRTALRTARAIFEASLIAEELRTDRDSAERFLDHTAVVAATLGRSERSDRLLKGKSLKAARHRRQKWLRTWEPRMAAAIERYGAGFLRGWDASTVFDRAKRAGRTEEYELYRFTSATVHGGSGSALGQLLTYSESSPVYRCGPNLAACPTALLYGIDSMKQFLTIAEKAGHEPARTVSLAIAELETVWQEYDDVLARADRGTWPEIAPPHFLLVAVIEPSGVHEYWLQDLALGRAIRADPAGSSAWARQRVAEMVKVYAARFPDRDVPQMIGLTGARGVPRAGARWEKAEEVLPDRERTQLGPLPGATIYFGDRAIVIGNDGLPEPD